MLSPAPSRPCLSHIGINRNRSLGFRRIGLTGLRGVPAHLAIRSRHERTLTAPFLLSPKTDGHFAAMVSKLLALEPRKRTMIEMLMSCAHLTCTHAPPKLKLVLVTQAQPRARATIPSPSAGSRQTQTHDPVSDPLLSSNTSETTLLPALHSRCQKPASLCL